MVMCPFCAGRRVSITNSLANLFPKIANQFHPTLNGDLTPETLTAGTGKKVWWKCPEGDDHVWECKVVEENCQKQKRQLSFLFESAYQFNQQFGASLSRDCQAVAPSKNGLLRSSDVTGSSLRSGSNAMLPKTTSGMHLPSPEQEKNTDVHFVPENVSNQTFVRFILNWPPCGI